MIVGVDTASSRWHAYDGERYHEWRASRDMVAAESRAGLATSFGDFLRAARASTYEDLHIAVEEPIVMLKNKDTTMALLLAAGALWAQHLGMDAFWHWVPVSSWNAHCGIKGKTAERKAAAKAYALERGAPDGLDEDHYDAFCVRAYIERELVKAMLT